MTLFPAYNLRTELGIVSQAKYIHALPFFIAHSSNFALAWAVPPGLSNIAYKTYFIFVCFRIPGTCPRIDTRRREPSIWLPSFTSSSCIVCFPRSIFSSPNIDFISSGDRGTHARRGGGDFPTGARVLALENWPRSREENSRRGTTAKQRARGRGKRLDGKDGVSLVGKYEVSRNFDVCLCCSMLSFHDFSVATFVFYVF